jgi:hypothetical protein
MTAPDYKDQVLLSGAAIMFFISTAAYLCRIGLSILFRFSKNVRIQRTIIVLQYISTSIGCFFFGIFIAVCLIPMSYAQWYIGLWILLPYWIIGFLVINRHTNWPKEKDKNIEIEISETQKKSQDIEMKKQEPTVQVPSKETFKIKLRTIVKTFFKNILQGFLEKKIFTIVMLLVITLLTIFFSLAICGSCLTFYPTFLSTSMSRIIFGQQNYCKWNSICYSYLTITEDIGSSMIVNYQYQGNNPQFAHVALGHPNGTNTTVQATCFRLTILHEEQRYQCWADLIGLLSNSTYYYSPMIMSDYMNISAGNFKFRTGPSLLSNHSFSFIEGGDVALSREQVALLKYASKLEPLFFIIGGDIAYENGDPNCYRKWDQFFNDWNEYMITPNGYSVPLLTCIGNHEASGFNVPRSYDAYYIRLFPHQTGLQSIDPQSRKLYHRHKIGSQTGIVLLDSSVHTSISDQTGWLKSTLNDMSSLRNKFVAYHVPVYGSKQSILEIGSQQQSQWIPLFDYYNVSIAFEHHFHLYKRTHKLFHNKISTDDRGTYYFGDGCMGIVEPYPASMFSKSPLLADVQNVPNIWYVIANGTQIRSRPYGYKAALQDVVPLTNDDIVM